LGSWQARQNVTIWVRYRWILCY